MPWRRSGNEKGVQADIPGAPHLPLSNRDIGYLPGDINDKLDPYMQRFLTISR
jgi:hypothetical protein